MRSFVMLVIIKLYSLYFEFQLEYFRHRRSFSPFNVKAYFAFSIKQLFLGRLSNKIKIRVSPIPEYYVKLYDLFSSVACAFIVFHFSLLHILSLSYFFFAVSVPLYKPSFIVSNMVFRLENQFLQ